MKIVYLRQVGNSFGVLLPKHLLSLAGFDLATPLTVIATAGEIRIAPAEGTAVILSSAEIEALLSADLQGEHGATAVAKLMAAAPK